MSKQEKTIKIMGPKYEDGSGERFSITYETNYKRSRLTIHQFSDDYVFVEGPFIQSFIDALNEAIALGEH